MPSLKRTLQALAAAAIVGAIGIVVIALHVREFLVTPVSVPQEGVDFLIAPGTPFATVSRELEDAGIVSDGYLLRLYARSTGRAADVQAGEYRIEPGMTPADLMQTFTSGQVKLYSFTIVEGWNHRELLAALHEHPAISVTMSAEDWPALLADLGAETRWPEGLFLPETYRFARGTPERTVLKQAYRLMQSVLAEEWRERAAGTPLASPYEALILASIVEKETARADERQRIAGVFLRRLEKRMRLQTDPTVIYGIGAGFNGNLTRRDLRTDTPYNTYTRHGLPPTPIAMPGRAAIHAALNPAAGNALYFVATGLGDGSHAFSATKDEHDAAVREYLARLRRKRN